MSYSAVKECISDMAANNTNATLAEYKVGLKVSYYTNVAHTTKTVHCTQTGTNVNTLINGCTYLSSTTYKNKSYDIILEYSEQGIVNYINIVSYGAY